jgi:hypothetical protein
MNEEWKEGEAYTAPDLILLQLVEQIRQLISEGKITEEDLKKFIEGKTPKK